METAQLDSLRRERDEWRIMSMRLANELEQRIVYPPLKTLALLEDYRKLREAKQP